MAVDVAYDPSHMVDVVLVVVILVFIQDLEVAGILTPGSAELARVALSSYYRNPAGSGVEARDLRAGRFY